MVHNDVVGWFLEVAVSGEGSGIVVAFPRDTHVGYDSIKMQNGAGDGNKCPYEADVARMKGEAMSLR